MMRTVNIDLKLGMKEIVAIAAAIPMVYEKLRKLKLKYDEKSQKFTEKKSDGETAYIFNAGDKQVILGPDGGRYYRIDT